LSPVFLPFAKRIFMKISFSALLLVSLALTGVQAQTVKDIDGNIYKTVTIGTKTWMAENLKTTRLNDGTLIPLVSVYDEWQALTTSGYCWYENNATSKNSYGALYNWYSVNSGKLCPTGWHAPTDAEWSALTNHYGVEEIAGGKLKEKGTTHWQDPNEGATNEGGFTALPGGHRGFNGAYGDLGDFGYWWSSTGSNATEAWYRIIGYRESNIQRLSFGRKNSGYSVRCVMGPAVSTNVPDASTQKPLQSVTVRNDQYRFEVTIPSDWSIRKGDKPDPDEGMKNGSPNFAMAGGDSKGEPNGWNGLASNSPYITIFANEKPEQKPEEFAKLLESTIIGFHGSIEKINRAFSVGDANGFDCHYTIGLKSRLVALYSKGIRVVFYTIQFPQNDTTLYVKNAAEIDKVIQSLRTK
jgi:uncharacterized protein (TIGR02145 family)